MSVSEPIRIVAEMLRQRREAANRLNLSMLQRRVAFEANAVATLAFCTEVPAKETIAGIACERLNTRAPGAPILYLHGGGYCVGSPRTHRELASRIARTAGRPCIVPDYRLAPDHPAPAGLDDAAAVYSALVAATGEELSVAGDSAGAGLALALCLRLKATGQALPSRLALMSPWTDMSLSGASIDGRADRDPYLNRSVLESFAEAYSPDFRNSDAVSPLFGDLAGLPPMLIQVGSDEVLLDDAVRLADRATKAGVTVRLEVGEGLFHVWQAVPTAPEAVVATDRIGAFLV